MVRGQRRSRSRRASRGRARLGPALALVVVLAVGVGACTTGGGGGAAAYHPAYGTAVAWTGAQLFVFGGVDHGSLRSDGALYRRDGSVARVVSSAPLPAPLEGPDAIRLGGRMLVLGLECPHRKVEPGSDSVACGRRPARLGAAWYSVSDDTWTRLRVPAAARRPGPELGAPFHWTATRIVGANRHRAVVELRNPGGLASTYWSVTADGRWSALGSPGTAGPACLTDDGTVAVLTGTFRDQAWTDLTVATVQPRDPSAGWRRHAPLAAVRIARPPDMSCAGGVVLVMEPPGGAAGPLHRFDLAAEAWRPVAEPPPAPAGEPVRGIFPARVWTGDRLVFLNTAPNFEAAHQGRPSRLLPSRVYEPASDRWSVVSSLSFTPNRPQWTGAEIVDFASDFAGVGGATAVGARPGLRTFAVTPAG